MSDDKQQLNDFEKTAKELDCDQSSHLARFAYSKKSSKKDKK